MSFDPGDEQKEVIRSTAPIVVVLGGAGSGKTTTAAAAARHRLELAAQGHVRKTRGGANLASTGRIPRRRVLLVSFSRTAVSQIIDRSADVMGSFRAMLEVVTFHGFAWKVLNEFGRFYGYPHPFRVQSSSESALPINFPGVRYDALIPAASKLLQLPIVRDYYDRRYVAVICDEFQDTSDDEWKFLKLIAPSAQRILLGDSNQCIYAGMKRIDPDARIAGACKLPGAARIELPPRSFRDPSGLLPAAALAAKNRDFGSPAITEAVTAGRISLRRVPKAKLAATVAGLVAAERKTCKTVNVFTHTHAATADLSAHLFTANIPHEQVGFGEAFGDGLQAQLACLRWAFEGAPGARTALAVYARSISTHAERWISTAILAKSAPSLETALGTWSKDLRHAARSANPDYDDIMNRLAGLHQELKFPRGLETWLAANAQLRRAMQLVRRGGTLEELGQKVSELRTAALVGSASQRPKPVQVMNLHQTKGREADASILLLQPDEFHGRECEPYPAGSRLVYVCLTRARERVHIVVPEDLTVVHKLWAPLIEACARVAET